MCTMERAQTEMHALGQEAVGGGSGDSDKDLGLVVQTFHDHYNGSNVPNDLFADAGGGRRLCC